MGTRGCDHGSCQILIEKIYTCIFKPSGTFDNFEVLRKALYINIIENLIIIQGQRGSSGEDGRAGPMGDVGLPGMAVRNFCIRYS